MATTTAPGKLNNTLRNTFFAVLLIAASIVGTLFLQDKIQLTAANADTPADQPSAIPPEPLFTPLEPFTVSLRDGDGSRVLYVGITLRVETEDSRQILNDYMPEVRDRVLAELTQQSTLHVHTPEGREQLAVQIKQALIRPYYPHLNGPRINQVLFTAYVVQ